ncbi:ribonuclease HII [Defluviicoccus vanus]|uniref:Ribonuclease HII n=1 Tax=Defluviicoccus vanus TaxID=111831 RepID=A0A7H1N2L1_9PROT|nr:ribonuclease HII [Defluviicoccus vanus]QNT69947.1 ribonuclease HII [Defluviicoccus vanus]
MPDLSRELAAGGIVAGVDEVGRGPWAGPVLAAAVVLDIAHLPAGLAAAIDDSKMLSRVRRERIFAALPAFACIGVGQASVEEIDRLNILQAALLAMQRAVAALTICPDLVLVDGNRAPVLPCPAQPVVGGDALCLSIAAASIVAKVTRDRLMADLAVRYPGYGWERNAGYGTAEHRAVLARLGPTPEHRRSFRPVRELCGG